MSLSDNLYHKFKTKVPISFDTGALLAITSLLAGWSGVIDVCRRTSASSSEKRRQPSVQSCLPTTTTPADALRPSTTTGRTRSYDDEQGSLPTSLYTVLSTLYSSSVTAPSNSDDTLRILFPVLGLNLKLQLDPSLTNPTSRARHRGNSALPPLLHDPAAPGPSDLLPVKARLLLLDTLPFPYPRYTTVQWAR